MNSESTNNRFLVNATICKQTDKETRLISVSAVPPYKHQSTYTEFWIDRKKLIILSIDKSEKVIILTHSNINVYQGIDRWLTSDFTSFSTVFQLYQDDGWMMM